MELELQYPHMGRISENGKKISCMESQKKNGTICQYGGTFTKIGEMVSYLPNIQMEDSTIVSTSYITVVT